MLGEADGSSLYAGCMLLHNYTKHTTLGMTDSFIYTNPLYHSTEQNRLKSPNKIASNHRTKSPQITEKLIIPLVS